METNWEWTDDGPLPHHHLWVIDLHDIDNPKLLVNAKEIKGWDGVFNVVADSSDPNRFFLNVSERVGTKEADGIIWDLSRHYALPYRLSGGVLTEEKKINLPGRLAYTLKEGDKRVLVTRDNRYVRIPDADYKWCTSCNYHEHPRLHVLSQALPGGSAVLQSSLNIDDDVREAGITDERLYLHVTGNYYVSNGEPYFERLLPYSFSSKGFVAGEAINLDGGFSLLHVGNLRPMLSLIGDGVLTLDGRDIQSMQGVRFSRTLGWMHNAALLPPHGYVAAGNFGTQHIHLDVMPSGTQL